MQARSALLRSRVRAHDDSGSAIIEFVFVAVIVMVPLIYLIVAVSSVQRSELAVSQAAREAGRAFATADTSAEAMPRARAAVRIALADQGIADDARLSFVPAGDSCSHGRSFSPALLAGAVFTVCVTRDVAVPAVPSVLAGRGITTIGSYLLHIDDYRAIS